MAASRSVWQYLVRFVAKEDGKTVFGNLDALPTKPVYEGLKARVLRGDPLGSYEITGEERTIGKLLSPLGTNEVPLIRCVGLNYGKHVAEGTVVSKPPAYPTLFVKGKYALADPEDAVPVPKMCQDETLDWEGELAFVISKDCKNVPETGDAWKEVVAGYTCGDDITWRFGQKDPDWSGTQWNSGKGIDKFAPIGPVLVSSSVLDPADLSLELRVNGTVRQTTRTNDMLSDVRKIVSHFSKGITLEKGTVVLSGTPAGVGYAMKPKVHLKDGDQVEVEIEGIGTLRHGIRYE